MSFTPSYRGEMPIDEFKKWLETYDRDKDGRISIGELERAIWDNGGWFSKAKANRVVKGIDENTNGFIDENERSKLLVFAQKQFGFKIVA